MIWRKKEWQNDTHLQVRIFPSKENTIISFAHERLINNQQREEVKKYWNEIMLELSNLIL